MGLKQWSYEQMKGAFSSTLYLSLSFFISVLILFKLIRRTKSKTKLNLPPSPPKLPIIGNLHQFGALPHRSLRDLSLKYGDMMMMQLGRQTPSLVVSSADVVREITKTHDIAFSDRAHTTAAKLCLYDCTDIGFALYGENWREKKKVCVQRFLSTKVVESFRLIRVEEVAELVNQLREASSADVRSVNLRELLLSTPMKIVYKCIFGRNYSEHNYNKVKDSIRKVLVHLAAFTVRDHFPLLGWIDVLTGKIRACKTTFEELDAALDEAIAEQITAKTNSKEKDFVDILLQLQEDNTLNIEFTKNDIKGIITDFLLGGTDAVASAIEWVILELVRNPMTMKKVQEEVRRVVGHKSNVEENDINEMHFLKCVVKETLRLHPPVPLLAPRGTRSSVKLNGYDIPAKTNVIINAWAIQRDPKFWKSPEEFMPERFEKSQVDFKGQESFQLIPFGFGRRGCPGMNFALAATEYVLASLLYWFDWTLPADSNALNIDMTEIFAFVVSTKVPLNVKPKSFTF
ncbi:cytochrome P450 71A1-like [Cajanus cajan]|uniref:cytochrome P450 71A1-like n=1 Tax=Cajanus cajan TaxID=3821 RepID=UPI00098D8A87|nr:cytochrome P450 71A1-like [Cajanus cajan]